MSTCIPSSSEVSVYCSEIFVNEFVRNDAQMDLPDEANDLLVTQILAILQRRAISTLVSPLLSWPQESSYDKQKRAALKGAGASRKQGQKEASAALLEYYHHVCYHTLFIPSTKRSRNSSPRTCHRSCRPRMRRRSVCCGGKVCV